MIIARLLFNFKLQTPNFKLQNELDSEFCFHVSSDVDSAVAN